MNKKNIISSLDKLFSYCETQNYKGYSLYDSHTSPFPFKKLGRTSSFLINQFVKRFPINIRQFIGVKKEYNPKGIGLFLNAFTLQKQLGNPLGIECLEEKINFFFQLAKE